MSRYLELLRPAAFRAPVFLAEYATNADNLIGARNDACLMAVREDWR